MSKVQIRLLDESGGVTIESWQEDAERRDDIADTLVGTAYLKSPSDILELTLAEDEYLIAKTDVPNETAEAESDE